MRTAIASQHLNSPDTTSHDRHAILETDTGYSIVLNCLGTDPKNVGVELRPEKMQLVVAVRKPSSHVISVSYWVFSLPVDADLRSTGVRLKNGVLEIRIAKMSPYRAIA